jgi:hypothetical protein
MICILKVACSLTIGHPISLLMVFLNLGCNENYIINCIFIQVPQEHIKHDYIVMFHVHDELEQLLF